MKTAFALNYLTSHLWAVSPQVLGSMANLAARNIEDIDLNALTALKPEAVAGRAGQPVTPRLEMREGGVAVLSVVGVISRYASMFDDICGGVSTDALAKEFNQALHDPTVSAIVLTFDSPGGDANGIHELAEMLYQARGKKPIKAYIGGTGASAIYWLASACDEVVIDATARLGSVGVVMSAERSRPSEDAPERLEIVSSQSPNKRLDVFTEDGQAAAQQQVDQLADVFVARVARNMSVSRETVLSDFGKGGILIGQAAVDKGMAHRLGSLETLITELNQGATPMTTKTTAESGKNKTIVLAGASPMQAADIVATLKAERPDVLTLLNPEPETALSAAEEIATACAEKGVPALSASLLKAGMSKADALAKIDLASGLKDKLSAAGLAGAFDNIAASLGNPLDMVGKAIYAAQSEADEGRDIERQTAEKGTPGADVSLSTKDVYKNRR
jgi:ClpP class serine protease